MACLCVVADAFRRVTFEHTAEGGRRKRNEPGRRNTSVRARSHVVHRGPEEATQRRPRFFFFFLYFST